MANRDSKWQNNIIIVRQTESAIIYVLSVLRRLDGKTFKGSRVCL